MLAGLKAKWKAFRQRYWLALGADLLVILLLFWAVHSWNTRHLPGGDLPSDLRLPPLDAAADSHALPASGPGVVYFFAPWCFYCRHSIGHIDELVRDGDVAWARAVALDYTDVDKVRQFIAETGLQQPVLLGDAAVARAWNIRAFPTYFVIGADGVISSRSVGYATRLGLEVRAMIAR
jgi:thiol-disulfide isomerase/thioredoxin